MSNEQDRSQIVFRVAASPRATLFMIAVIGLLLAVGMFVPQQIAYEDVASSYSASWSQVFRALDLHRIGSSWLLQGSVVLLVLNLLARLLASQIPGHTRSIPAGGETLKGPNGRPDDMLKSAFPRARVQLVSPGLAEGRLGLAAVGLALLGVGLLILGGAYAMAMRSGTLGKVELVTGSDKAATSRFVGYRLDKDVWLPWKPPFQMRCAVTADATMLGERQCLIDYEGKAHQATLTPGRDLEFMDLRLTMVGLNRVTGVGGFDVVVERDGKRNTQTGAVGSPLDVIEGGELMATILPTGNAPGDPVGIVPGGDVPTSVLSGMKVSTRPRTMITLRVASVSHVLWVWIGLSVLGLALFLALVLPSYRIVLRRAEDGWTVNVDGVGLLAKDAMVLEALATELNRRASA